VSFTCITARYGRERNHTNPQFHPVVHAQYIQPAIKTLGTVEIDNGHFVSDIMFDSIFTDLAQHDRIKESNAQIEASYKNLLAELKVQGGRADAARRAAADAAEALEQARKNLQDTRAQAFESYAAGGLSAPPAYQAV
jgi:GTP cyclohydrolase III